MIIELCSGYGQQIYPADIKIDIDASVRPDIVADVRYLPLRPGIEPDILWMSPPCTFTTKADWAFPRPGIRQAFDIIGACLESISYLKPRMWILESPVGHLTKYMPTDKVKMLWAATDINTRKKESYLYTNRRSKVRSHITRVFGVK